MERARLRTLSQRATGDSGPTRAFHQGYQGRQPLTSWLKGYWNRLTYSTVVRTDDEVVFHGPVTKIGAKNVAAIIVPVNQSQTQALT